MPAPFAALEARTAAAVLARLANVEATIGITTVSGIFDAPSNNALNDFVTGNSPTFLAQSSTLPAITIGITTLTMAVTVYTIAEVRPDGAGMTTLVLERV
jgi:hypothetical protein